MKRNLTIVVIWALFLSLSFFFAGCGGDKEKTGEKTGEVTKESVAKQETEPKPMINKKQAKPNLPKKLLEIELTDEQRAKCEAAYREIYTPEILAQTREMYKKRKIMKQDSKEYMDLTKEINLKLKPYNVQFRNKLKEILSPEQQQKYFAKK